MDPSQFIDRRVYIKMMSYDKPIDWQAGKKAESEKKLEPRTWQTTKKDSKIEIPSEMLKDINKNIGKDNRKSL